MADVQSDIIGWLGQQPVWLQTAAVGLLRDGAVSEDGLAHLFEQLAAGKAATPPAMTGLPGLAAPQAGAGALRLVSLGNVRGIDRLAPRRPLEVGAGNLTVVYGRNGSGKSGYARILKRACKLGASELRHDVFGARPERRGCTITYRLGDTNHAVDWDADGPAIEALAGVDIFDGSSGAAYLRSETAAAYTPPSVALFEALAHVCGRMKDLVTHRRDQILSRLPPLPADLAGTEIGRAYTALPNQKKLPPPAQSQRLLVWSDSDEQALAALTERLAAPDPAGLARDKREIRSQLVRLVSALASAGAQVSAEACAELGRLKERAQTARRVATEGAQVATAAASLAGIGTETWRALWQAARAYSAQEVYPGQPFPQTGADASCVLCQQPIGAEAGRRLQDLERYVQGTLEADARAAEEAWRRALAGLAPRPTDQDLGTACRAAGLDADLWLPRLSGAWAGIDAIRAALADPSATAPPAGLPPTALAFLEELHARIAEFERQAAEIEAQVAASDRAGDVARQLELRARQYVAGQAKAVRAELERLGQVAQHEAWLKEVTGLTRRVSTKSGELSKTLITQAYVERFNRELQALGADRIRVDLEYVGAKRGLPRHRIQLQKLSPRDANPAEILSEGEQRIVTLAAFLADVTGRTDKGPFSFDDPISSRDQRFEERAVRRLIELSADRQVLAFTHRLSFMALMAAASGCEALEIRQSGTATGDPGDVPLYAKRPASALRRLRDQDLAQAHGELRENGWPAYELRAKALCGHFRDTLERVVEVVLLGGVVERYRRDISFGRATLKLATIHVDDCVLIDRMYAKYCRYVHPPAQEAPVDLPEPDEIAQDLEEMITWCGDFAARPAAATDAAPGAQPVGS